jgi:small subunit ribosomal protein S6
MLVMQPDIEDPKASAEEFGEVVRGLGGEVEKIDLWGKRRLAYPIQKRQEGVYALLQFKLANEQVKELQRLVGLRPQVLRRLVTLREEK